MKNETVTSVEYTHIRALKGRIRASRPHFIQKVCGHRVVIDDAYKGHFHSFLNVFMPKLTPEYQKPCVMLHAGNGSGSILIRVTNPLALADKLESIIIYLRSNNFLDNYAQLCAISDKLISGDDVDLDKTFLDEKQFEREILKS